MKTELFEHEMTGTAKTFGRKADAKVLFQGNEAKTDGSTIIFPAMPNGEELDRRTQGIGRGYVDHEAAHLRHTDMKVFTDALEYCEEVGHQKLGHFINAIEDVRIEKKVIREYAGAKGNLSVVNEAVNQHFLEELEENPDMMDDEKIASALAITWQGRENAGYATDTNRQCLDLLSEEMQERIKRWVEVIDQCQTTTDSVAVAKAICDEEATGEPMTPPPMGGSGSPLTGGGKDSDHMDGDGNPVDNSDGKSGGGSRESGVGAGERSKPSFDPSLSAAVTRAFDGKVDSDNYTILSREHDKWHTRKDSNTKYKGYQHGTPYNNFGCQMNSPSGKKRYDEVQTNCGSHIAHMRSKLQRAIMAKMNRDWDFGRIHGRLDTKRLVSAYNRHDNVYKMRTDADEIDTAVSVLIDLSGSMMGTRVNLAEKVVICLAEVFEKTGCSYEVLGFNNTSGYHNSFDYGRAKNDFYRTFGVEPVRREPLDMYLFKAWDERLYEAKRALGSIHRFANGNNSDPDAVLEQYNRIRVRREKKKIMLVLSDGQPAHGTDGNGNEVTRQYLRDVVKMATAGGVHCVGIGIQSEAVRYYYPQYTVCNDISDLPKATMSELSSLLIGGRFKVDNRDLIEASR